MKFFKLWVTATIGVLAGFVLGSYSVAHFNETKCTGEQIYSRTINACYSPNFTHTTQLVEGLKEPIYPPYCWVQPPHSDLWYPCDSVEVKMLECLNLMELAMKEIDPFVPSLEHANMLPILDDPDHYQHIIKLWDRAKNTCWSDLKDLQPQHYH